MTSQVCVLRRTLRVLNFSIELTPKRNRSFLSLNKSGNETADKPRSTQSQCMSLGQIKYTLREQQ